jgi:hypothetical protein
MSLTIDPTISDLNEWTGDVSLVDHWLYSMWGVGPRHSSPTRSSGRVHPSGVAEADWLTALWGFDA